MASKNVVANIAMGLTLDKGNLQSQFSTEVAGLQKMPPVKIKTEFGKDIKIGNAQGIFNDITKGATALESLTGKYTVFQTKAGNSVKALTGMNVVWKNSVGDIEKAYIKVAAVMEKGSEKVGSATVIANVGKQARAIEKGWTDQGKAIDAISLKATEWNTRAQAMEKKEGTAIQQSAEKIRMKVAEYDKLVAKGKLVAANKVYEQLQKENIELDKNIALSKRAATGVRGWADTMLNAVKQTIAYTFSLGTLRAAQQLMNEAMQFTIDLNKEMIKIQVLQAEGAQSDAEIRTLAMSYNELAKAMGVTTIEVAKGSVEWLRQGKTIEETTQLLKSSTMLSKLGALESAEATELLTSTVNSYKIAVEDVTSVVDKMVAVDNNSATSTREIATALRYTAATAAEAGVSLEALISYIATMSSVTRINAESIGQSMKTILTRMQDIKAGKIDEDGLGLNNVESALMRINVPLRDSATSFRNLDEVLEDVAAKWSTLNDIEQANISKAIAGVRQANLFKVLMSNMGDALKYQAIEADSAGTAMDRYNIYLQGVEASQNKLKASLEGLFMSAKGFDNLLITLNTLGATILDLITNAGGLPTIFIAASTALAIYVAITSKAALEQAKLAFIAGTEVPLALGKQIFATYAASASLGVMQASMKAAIFGLRQMGIAVKGFLASIPGIGWAALALGVLVEVINYAAGASERAAEAQRKLNEEIIASREAYEQAYKQASTVREMTSDLELFNKMTENGTDLQKLSAEQLERYYEIQKTLTTMFPDILHYYDSEGRAIIDETVVLDELVKKKQEDIDKTKEQMALAGKQALKGAVGKYDTQDTGYGGVTKQGINPLAIGFEAGYVEGQGDVLTKETKDAINKATPQIKQAFYDMGYESALEYIDSLKNPELKAMLTETLEATFKDSFAKQTSKSMSDFNKFGMNALAKGGMKVTISVTEFNSRLKTAKLNIDKVAEAKKKLEKQPFLSDSERMELQDMGVALKEVAGGWIITDEAFLKYVEDTASGIENGAILTEGMNVQTEALRSNAEALEMSQDSYKSNINALSDAAQELSDTGNLSANTIESLVDAGYGAAIVYDELTGKFTLSAEAARLTAIEQMKQVEVSYRTKAAAEVVKGALGSMASSYLALADAAAKATQAMMGQTGAQFMASIRPSGGGGGGGGGKEDNGNDEEVKAQEKKIKNLEKKKDKLQDALKEYKKWIDAQKESLKLQKEEADFNDEIAKKNKSLAKLKTQIYILSLDQSQDAKAKRLKLEEEAAILSEEITKKYEDRKYDLQAEALDKMADKFEESINRQIDAIELMIEKIRELIEVLKNALSLKNKVTSAPSEKRGATWNASKQQFINTATGNQTSWSQIDAEASKIPGGHTGGLAYELHHDGDFAGNLKSNEVYAKLLKGEYVATEGQMNNFMKNILPKMANITAKGMVQNQGGDTNQTTLNLTVNGNLDKVTLQDVKKEVFSSMNKALKSRGKQKNAFTNSI